MKKSLLNLKCLIQFSLTLAVLLISLFAKADKAGPDSEKFAARLAEEQKICARNAKSCPLSTLQSQILFERIGNQSVIVSPLEPEFIAHLELVAQEQAQIWGDTILEGDYTAAGSPELDRVEGYFDQNGLVSYRIVYSEKAWFTGDCEPATNIKACNEGRIQEATYVSPSAKTWILDRFAYADFMYKN